MHGNGYQLRLRMLQGCSPHMVAALGRLQPEGQQLYPYMDAVQASHARPLSRRRIPPFLDAHSAVFYSHFSVTHPVRQSSRPSLDGASWR